VTRFRGWSNTPKGSRNKYKFDERGGFIRLSRILPAGMSFPYDFGSIPRTRAEDEDALDVLVLTDASLFVSCLVRVHLIGVIRATQTEKRKTIPVFRACERANAHLLQVRDAGAVE
jgi:inorganic pyrophosphatase